MFFKPQHVHFVGIGGIGMSGLAEILLTLGYPISGSDVKLSAVTDRLTGHGAQVYEGHAASNLGDARAVVVTSAVDAQNPEVLEARRRQLPIIPRGELLAEMMRLKFGIAVAGSHGKTTTTSMVSSILSNAGLDPTIVVGGRVNAMGGANARLGQSQFLVVESDESDGSFLKLAPIIAIVTNIDREHLDHYSDLAAIEDAFAHFVNKVPFYGAAILCIDDDNVQQILPRINRRVITYGAAAQADLRVIDAQCGRLATEFGLRWRERELGRVHLRVPGYHNVLNASAAFAVGLELEIPVEKIVEGLAQFNGVDRRFQLKGEAGGVTIIDDYGHHPTEIRATLAAAQDCEFRRIHVIFQPHRFTRTLHLMDDFAKAFSQADYVYLLDIYAASEKPIDGVTAEALTARMRQFGHRGAEYCGTLANAVAAALENVQPGDAILTLGAGNVWQAGESILSVLQGGK